MAATNRPDQAADAAVVARDIAGGVRIGHCRDRIGAVAGALQVANQAADAADPGRAADNPGSVTLVDSALGKPDQPPDAVRVVGADSDSAGRGPQFLSLRAANFLEPRGFVDLFIRLSVPAGQSVHTVEDYIAGSSK